MVDKEMYPLEAIAEYMSKSYVECSDLAMNHMQENGIEGLDDSSVFTDDESKSLAVIALVMWQAIFAAMRTENFIPNDDARVLDAIIDQIRINHFG